MFATPQQRGYVPKKPPKTHSEDKCLGPRGERECYYVKAIVDGIRVEKLENGLKGVLLLEICIFYEPGCWLSYAASWLRRIRSDWLGSSGLEIFSALDVLQVPRFSKPQDFSSPKILQVPKFSKPRNSSRAPKFSKLQNSPSPKILQAPRFSNPPKNDRKTLAIARRSN